MRAAMLGGGCQTEMVPSLAPDNLQLPLFLLPAVPGSYYFSQLIIGHQSYGTC